MPSGGPRPPAKPSPVSGPGRLSKRTDGGPGAKLSVANDLPYGERQETLSQERIAPMATTPAPSPDAMPGGAPQGGPAQGMNLGAPSARPDEPITHGVDIGGGAGAEVMPVQQQPAYQALGPMSQMLAQLSVGDRSGALAQLYQSALSTGA